MRKKRLLIFLGYAQVVLGKLWKIGLILYRLAELAEKIYKIISHL
jgi:hypothetical protein